MEPDLQSRAEAVEAGLRAKAAADDEVAVRQAAARQVLQMRKANGLAEVERANAAERDRFWAWLKPRAILFGGAAAVGALVCVVLKERKR